MKIGITNGSSSKEQLQADWSQNDSSALDYIKNKPTVDQTYNSTSTNAQSGRALYDAKFLRDLSTSDSTGSLGIKGSAGGSYNTIIGNESSSAGYGYVTALGYGAKVKVSGGWNGIAIGVNAVADGNGIQIGTGTSPDANLYIGYGVNGTSTANYKLLDLASGLIPDERISTAIARVADITSLQAQADWSQTNSTLPDYIKNKPTTLAGFGITDAQSKIDATHKLNGAYIQDSSITSTQLGNGAVTTAKIADNAITSDKIKDGTITNADISADANIASSKIRFTDAENTALRSGIDSTKVAQITNNARDIDALEDWQSGASIDIANLRTTVGSSSSGLVKDMADAKNSIESQGIRLTTVEGKVSSLETTVGNSSSGLVKDVADLKSGKQDKLTAGTGIDITNGVISNTNASATWGNITGTLADQTDLKAALDAIEAEAAGDISPVVNRVTAIENKIPNQASSSNQLADKDFVNSSIQTNTAFFDGSWNTWADVPSTVSGFTAAGFETPSINNYLVVIEDETQDGGTWRYKYSSDSTTYSKTNWKAEYEVNETPLTAEQLAALNSGITSALVGTITNNKSAIASYGNIVTHNVSEFATAAQGAKAATALQSSALNNTTLTGSTKAQNLAVSGTLTQNGNTVLTTASELSGSKLATSSVTKNKLANSVQDSLDKADNVAATIDSYGNIVTHNVSEFATAAQGAKAETALQQSALTDTQLIGNTKAQNLAVSGSLTTNNNYVLTTASELAGSKLAAGSVSKLKLDADVQAALTKAENTIQSIETGSANGTISVDGTDVAVKGLATVATSGSYNDLLNKPTIPEGVIVDQSFDPVSTNAISSKALYDANFVTNDAGYQDAMALGNSSSSQGSVSLGKSAVISNTLGDAGGQGTAIGYQSKADDFSVAIGSNAKTNSGGTSSIAIGSSAVTSASNAIQLGTGTNSTANSLQVKTYKLLDTSTGIIPDDRISSNIARASSVPTVDQTYNSTSTNAQSGKAIDGAKFLRNTASGTSSLAIVGSTSSTSGSIAIGSGASIFATGTNGGFQSIAIGAGAQVGSGMSEATQAIAIGAATVAFGTNSIALGHRAWATNRSIQIGYGKNTTAKTLQIGFGDVDSEEINYQLLDGNTGLIPDARLSSNIARVADLPSAQVQSDWNVTDTTSKAYIANKPTIPTVDQTYSASSANAQSGAAIAGAKFLQNTATGDQSVAIGDASQASNIWALAIGYQSKAAGTSVALGWNARATADDGDSSYVATCTAVGRNAKASKSYAVSLGGETEATGEASVALGGSSRAQATGAIAIGGICSGNYSIHLGRGSTTADQTFNVGTRIGLDNIVYQMLDLTTGKIPNDRLNLDSTPTSASTNGITSGAVYTALQNVHIDVDSALSTTSENPVQNKVVKSALDAKQNTLTWSYDSATETLTIS